MEFADGCAAAMVVPGLTVVTEAAAAVDPPGADVGCEPPEAERRPSSGTAASRNFAKLSARRGAAPGKRTVCGFMWTPFIRYS